MCHGIRNITFHVFCCSKSALCFFGICRKRTSMHHILHNDLHFSPHTCHANPAGSVIWHVFRHTNLRFFHEFHAPHASETQVLCFPNVLGLKSIRNCRFQPKTSDFLQKWHVSVKYVSRNPKYHVSCVLLSRIRTLIFCNFLKTQVNASYSP